MDHHGDVSFLGDVSPLKDEDAYQTRRVQSCRFRSMCSFAAVAIYALLYISLSSNPSMMVLMPVDDQPGPAASSLTAAQFYDFRESHIQEVASTIARVYTPVSPEQWCIDGRLKYEQAKRKPMGLCYLKIPRASSTTLQGINVRIARNFARRKGLTEMEPDNTCIRHDGHTPGAYYQHRERALSYFWTFLRNPTDRAMSRVASNLAKNQNAATTNSTEIADYVVEALQTSTDVHFGTISEGRGGFQVQYSMTQLIPEYSAWYASHPNVVQNPRDVQRRVKQIIDAYDFIGVVERFDESLVALQLLLGLDPSDILYFATHQAYSHKHRRKGRENCLLSVDHTRLQFGVTQEYLESATWWAQNYGDWLLHQAASQSLDQTILQIGLKPFGVALKEFRALLDDARQICTPIFPCSSNGTDQSGRSESNCYFDSVGCGYPCLDALTSTNKIDTKEQQQ